MGVLRLELVHSSTSDDQVRPWVLDRSASRMLNSPGVPGLVRVPPECTENRWTQPRGCTPWWSRRAVARSGNADSLRFVRPSTYPDALASVPNDIPRFRVRTTDCGVRSASRQRDRCLTLSL